MIFRLVDKLFDPLVRHSMRNTRAFVDEPHRARRLMLTEGLLFIIALSANVVRDWLDGWEQIAAMLVSSIVLGTWAFAATRRGQAYQHGWLDGRMRMVDALRESVRRGHSLEDWLDGELQRDYFVMGVRPLPAQEGGDDEH
jgi:hypothetical protein